VPRIIVFLAKADIVSKYDLSSVRDILCGAAPLKQEIESLAAERLGLHQIRQGYGLTEATLALMVSPNNRKKVGSSGILVPETECKVSQFQQWLIECICIAR
jgi:long-subunit acyl-CoA synthetase (AMP-forming)